MSVAVRGLDGQQAADLRAAAWSYSLVEGTEGDTPSGYAGLVRSAVLARRDLDGAAHDLLGWRVHERAGLRVEASRALLDWAAFGTPESPRSPTAEIDNHRLSTLHH